LPPSRATALLPSTTQAPLFQQLLMVLRTTWTLAQLA
jgi:hypothetical protein